MIVENEKNYHIIQVFSNLFEQSIKNTIISQKKKKNMTRAVNRLNTNPTKPIK
jgi:hypothetical protein